MSKEFLKSAINDAAKATQREIEEAKAAAERKRMLKIIEEKERFKKTTNFILKMFSRNKSLTIQDLKTKLNDDILANPGLYRGFHCPSDSELMLIVDTLYDDEFICRYRNPAMKGRPMSPFTKFTFYRYIYVEQWAIEKHRSKKKFGFCTNCEKEQSTR